MAQMPQRGGWWPDCLGTLVILAIVSVSAFMLGFWT